MADEFQTRLSDAPNPIYEQSYPIIVTSLAIVACSLLGGCVSSSGVVQTGPNTYMIARTEERLDGSSGNVKAAVIKEANAFCEKHGKVMKIISTSQKDMIPFKSDATAEVHFKCLSPDDPELRAEASPVKEVLSKEGKERPSADDADLYTKLAKLDELRKKGILTEAEFDAEKKKLLARSK